MISTNRIDYVGKWKFTRKDSTSYIVEAEDFIDALMICDDIETEKGLTIDDGLLERLED